MEEVYCLHLSFHFPIPFAHYLSTVIYCCSHGLIHIHAHSCPPLPLIFLHPCISHARRAAHASRVVYVVCRLRSFGSSSSLSVVISCVCISSLLVLVLVSVPCPSALHLASCTIRRTRAEEAYTQGRVTESWFHSWQAILRIALACPKKVRKKPYICIHMHTHEKIA
jgi:hypothetical protein